MSAFIVTKAHVAAIVRFAGRPNGYKWYEKCNEGSGWSPRVAGMLYAQNVRSVNHRYEGSTPDEPVAFTRGEIDNAPLLPAVAVVKLCHSLAYQSCETSDWETTDAAKFLRAVESDAVSRIPGYEEAEWAL